MSGSSHVRELVDGAAPEQDKHSLAEEYQLAVAMLRQIQGYARGLARSGNPGRRDAGHAILAFMEANR